jgi:hypothetical protein
LAGLDDVPTEISLTAISGIPTWVKEGRPDENVKMPLWSCISETRC